MEKVKTERIVLGLASIANPNIEKVGDCEVLIYLMPASLRAPLPHILAQIYLYLVTKVCGKNGKEIPSDIRKTELTTTEEGELRELRDMIYRKRGGDICHPVLNMLRDLNLESKP